MSGVTYQGLEPVSVGRIPAIRVDFLRRQLWAKGVDATWEKASRCPCARFSPTVGTAGPYATTTAQGECPACKGTGLVYFGSQAAKVLILSPTSRSQRSSGQSADVPGQVSITALTEQPVSIYDRVATGVLRRFTESFTKSAGVLDTLRFPIAAAVLTVGSSGDHTVPATQTTHVEYCIAADANGDVVGGATPTVYREGVHFTVADDGANAGLLDWTLAGGSRPPAGVRIGIRYVCRQRYIVTSLPYTTRVSGPLELFHKASGLLDGLGDA